MADPFTHRVTVPPYDVHIRDYLSLRGEYKNFLENLEALILGRLRTDPTALGDILAFVRGSQLLVSESARDDVVTEVANIIVAAAAVESKSYEGLIALVNALKTVAGLEEVPLMVASAALCRHTGQTNFFVLGLLRDNPDVISVVRAFADQRGVCRAAPLMTFVYFAPELQASDPPPRTPKSLSAPGLRRRLSMPKCTRSNQTSRSGRS
jgi:hypothetical protein